MVPPSEAGRRAPRLLLCLATSLVVSATAYLCAWRSFQNIFVRPEAYLKTRADLERLAEDVERYWEATGSWPERLADLGRPLAGPPGRGEDDPPLDGWGRPFQYRAEADGYVLFSHGGDGKPGGVGRFADLYAGQEDAWVERPTLGQLATMPESLPVRLACVLAGVVAFPICLVQARGRPGERPSLGKVLLAHAVTGAFAVFAACVLGALHVLPGH